MAAATAETGTRAEEMFHMLPCCMQCEAGPLIPKIFEADALLRERTDHELVILCGTTTCCCSPPDPLRPWLESSDSDSNLG